MALVASAITVCPETFFLHTAVLPARLLATNDDVSEELIIKGVIPGGSASLGVDIGAAAEGEGGIGRHGMDDEDLGKQRGVVSAAALLKQVHWIIGFWVTCLLLWNLVFTSCWYVVCIIR